MTTQALITGGTRGIGLGLTTRLRAGGAQVLATGRTDGDLADPAARERLAARVRAAMPGLDLLIDNAGVQRRVALAADDAPWAERQAEIDVLFCAPVHLNNLLVPLMLAHGRPATIVVVTSGGALIPQPFAPVYSAAKAALHSYTQNLRLALAGTNVRVVELMPPAVATGLGGDAHGADVEEFCDAALAGLDAGEDEIGFGPTAAPAVRDRLAVERAMFTAGSARFPVAGYARAE